MFAKKLLEKAIHHHHKGGAEHGNLMPTDFDPHIQVHLGIPSTSSILAVDPIQRLLAIGTLDGRIKVIGRDNNEALFISSKQSPYKSLEFLQNQGYLVGILIDNDIEVWNLESRCVTCNLQWESNITAFSVIPGSPFLLLGDEYGVVSVVKFSTEDCELVETPYQISPDYIAEKAGVSFSNDRSVIGVLPQPYSSGNRLLIAYQNGLIIVWDVLKAEVAVTKGGNDLHVKGHLSNSSTQLDTGSNTPLELMNEKEISALCWASSFGSMLAVGYIDGDILLWNIPTTTTNAIAQSRNIGSSCNDVVKLQLSSTNKRLPIILLRWGESGISQNNYDGQLFVYGGSEIGSEEVITVVNLQWSTGMEALKGVRRVDLSLIGSFADMTLLSSHRTAENSDFDGLFVLNSPGKLQFYDLGTLSPLERTSSISGIEYPVVVPTCNPQMTTAKFTLHPYDGKLAMWLSEMVSINSTLEEKKWPLTEGMRSDLSYSAQNIMTRIYIVGYRDGSVRIWNATSPILTLVSVLEGQVNGLESDDSNVAITKLDLCASMMTLAVGTENGLIRFYSLENDVEVTKLHLLKHSEHKVFDVPSKRGPQCRAVFSMVNSSVTSLQFFSSGTKLAVGFKSSHVAVFDTISPSVLFLTDSIINSKSPVISITCNTFSDVNGFRKIPNRSEPKNLEQKSDELLFTLIEDGNVSIVNSKTGIPISSRPFQSKELKAISMYVLADSNLASETFRECEPEGSRSIGELKGPDVYADGLRLLDSQLLVCYENVLCLYHVKSIIQGEDKPIRKVKLANSCCWTSIFKKDGNICGLVLCYQSGVLEVRSCPGLELVTESSLSSVLRWSFRPNMEKTVSATDNGHICLANGSELAVISVSTMETERRFLESLALLHDKTIRYSGKLHKQAGPAGGIAKGLRKEKLNNSNILPHDCDLDQLEKIFSQPVILPANMEGNEEELDIDDIEIDEPVLVASTTTHQRMGKTTESEREKLFEGASDNYKPRTRTPEEIMAAYRGAEYASSAAERARNKLLERQEKLERISQRTEELRSGAEDFASMANELARTMEARKKWWKI